MAQASKEVKTIFAEAIQKTTSEELNLYLDAVCSSNAQLRAEVESLLASHRDAGEFLAGLLEEHDTEFKSSLTEKPGEIIGRYKLLEKIGEGGMAVVYMAEQTEPIHRKVALKIIKLGMDTKSVIARFEAERQALAIMDHPNIAKVLDAGATETGRPYFVMELVTGVSITEYCDKNNLSTKERLTLFIQVCNAVQHAHQKGIIHRDIKPTNVMVTHHDGKPVPKVIDFGIAKAINQKLTEKTLFTRYAHIIGTPAYMSPEQAELSDLDVDTRSDIYSLGVLLYELLTGTTPFSEEELRKAGYIEMQRVIREQEPPKPSTKLSTLGETLTDIAKYRNSTPNLLKKAIRGDLDWIVMKSLEKDRSRRYETANMLVLDILHHLEHEPVMARGPGTRYRVHRFLRRHRSQTVVALALLVVTGAAVVILSMWNHDRLQLAEAEGFRHRNILSQAREQYAKSDRNAALETIKPILGSRHIGPEARLLCAGIFVDNRRYDEAVTMLKELLDDRAEIAGAAHSLLARILWETESSNAEKLKEIEEHRQKAEQLLPETAEAYFLRAMTAVTVKEQLASLDKALQHDPGHYESHRIRAYIYQASRKYETLEHDALAMMVLRPQEALGYSLRAFACNRMGCYEEALKHCNSALRFTSKMSTDYAELCAQRCEVLMNMDRFDRVIAIASEGLQDATKDAKLSFHLYCALIASGRYSEAENVAARATQENPGYLEKAKGWAVKYVFDRLETGRRWYPPDSEPRGHAFSDLIHAQFTYRNLSLKAKRLITDSFTACSSPDGTKVAFSLGFYGFSGVALYKMETGDIDLLIVPGKDPAWSPDGRYLVFARDCQTLPVAEFVSAERISRQRALEDDEVWIMNADGTEPRRLTTGTAPCWSQDGKHIYYRSADEGILYKMSVENGASDPQRLLRNCYTFPTMSPDEKYVAYMQGKSLMIAELASQSVVTEWVSPFPILGVSWCANGHEICIGGRGSIEDIGSGLWVYDLETKQARRVLKGPVFTWKSEPTRLLLNTESPYFEIWEIDLDPNASVLDTLGSDLTVEEYFQEMIDFHTQKIEVDPENPNYYFLRAKYYNCLDDRERAHADMNRYVALRRRERKISNLQFGTPKNLGPAVNTQREEGHPLPLVDELSLIFCRRNVEGRLEYWCSERKTAGSPWQVTEKLSSVNKITIPGTTTDDGLECFVYCWPGEYGSGDVCVRTRPNRDADWSEPRNLGPIVNSSAREMSPAISPDGLELYFSGYDNKNIRPGGQGASDLWVARRTSKNARWTEPDNLGPIINSPENDCRPSLSADGLLLLFDSARSGGQGSFDVWMIRRASLKAPWGSPMNLGPMVNSPAAEYFPHLSADGSTLYYVSDRPGGCGHLDIWQASVVPIVDFSGDGIVDDIDLSVMEAHWGENYKPCDISPMPSGDGVINEMDKELLMAHWGQVVEELRLVSHWKLDETEGNLALDSQGKHHGSVHGSAVWQSSGGRFGGALQLDAIDDYVETGLEHDLSQSPFRVFAWIKGGAPGQAIVSQETEIADHHSVWLGLDPVNGHLVTGHLYPTLPLLKSDSHVTDDRWHQVGLLWDGIYRHLCVDGEEVASDSVPFLPPISRGRLRLGVGSNLEPTTFWSGLIDDVRFLIPPSGPHAPEVKQELKGFQIYRDGIGSDGFNTSYVTSGALDYSWDTDCAEGDYCIYWTGAAQYNEIRIDFRPDKDLSQLVDEGYALEFWFRGNGAGPDFDVRFLDTKSDYPADHPWRMRRVISTSVAPRDGQWHHVRIPLQDFVESGSWDNDTWYNSQGDFDWAAIDYFAIEAEYGDLEGVQLWFDDIQISK